jgi:menaquinone reductase, multiheme cytochrome c subunit
MISSRGPILFAAGFLAVFAAGWRGFPAILYERSPQPLQFNHKVHKEKASMACTDCHSFRADGSFAGIPATSSCANCHAAAMGDTAAEKKFIDQYVTPGLEVPWKSYTRQPMNVRFSHAAHVTAAKLKCEQCHGDHGATSHLRDYEENRISGYSRDIWGHSITRVGLNVGDGRKMSDCEDCHAQRKVEVGCLGCHQ